MPTRIRFADRDVRLEDPKCDKAKEVYCFSVPWFKHFDKEEIERYASLFRKVAENYKDLLDHDKKEEQGGRWFGSENV